MTYANTTAGTFISRPNRFIARVDVDGETVVAHVKNTGRCKELLVPEARVILQKSDNPERKTGYDLIAVWKGERLINMDSQAPNKVFFEHLQSGQYIDGVTLDRCSACFIKRKSRRKHYHHESALLFPDIFSSFWE